MSKAKKTDTETKTTKREVIKDDAKEAVDDTLYQKLVDRGVDLCRDYESTTLVWYWDMGKLFEEFRTKILDKIPGRSAEHFAKDLSDRANLNLATSTLYFARQIHIRYEASAIKPMAAAGVGVTHLKTLLAIKDDAQLKKIEAKMFDKNGQVISTRDLAAVVEDLTRQAARAERLDAQDQAAKAIETTPAPAKARAERESEETQQEFSPEAPEGKAVDTKPAAKADDGQTGSRGATPTKEYSHSPLKAFKAIENAATKLTAVTADAVISATEVVKIGYDHPQAKKNARDALAGAHAAVKDLQKLLPDLETRLREALEDVNA